MDIRILGPLEVEEGSQAVTIPGPRQHGLLALLLLRRNEVVSSDRLLEELWAKRPLPSSQNALQAAVSRLRRALPAGRLVTRPPGYLLRLEPGELDAERFERLLEDGRSALAGGDAKAAAELLERALSLWRGPALVDFTYEPFAQTEIARLEELRLEALEEQVDADLALGRHADVVARLEALVDEHPLRERPRSRLMLALYRSGRQADALEAFRATRTLLLDELGLEPGPELRLLERRILAQDPGLDLQASRPPISVRTAHSPHLPETRRTVTVLACGLAGSTGLTANVDPEVLRELLGRYATVAAEAVSAHGGTMEQSVGDEVTAVFGVPALHEDDGLRALRAALDLRERVATLDRDFDVRLQTRIGIETGEVVAGDARSGEALVTGAVVSTAMRLRQEAPPGEIVLGEATRRLAAGAARVEPCGDTAPAGERDGATAWRLLELLPGAPTFTRHETPLVGREAELQQLEQSFARGLRERTPYLLTVVGPPGIGKSRLARELAAAAAATATVLVGRCLSYGEGITFRPLREIVLQAPEGELRTRVSRLLDDEAASLPAGTASATTDEIFLAARRLLESLARERPLLVVLEDLHWADPTFLDFVERLAAGADDAPMLLLCLARDELFELRESWGSGVRNAVSLRLGPLTDGATETLLDALGARPHARGRVTELAEGNPLFAEQLLAWLEEGGGVEHDRSLPPTIQAVLAARLDRLGPAEAAVLQRAAVVGRDAETEAVRELLPADARPSLARHLDALARKGLIEPQPAQPGEHERFRFVHALVQEAAYRMVSKRLRAELHERLAHRLEESGAPRREESDEILGYHLEQAHRWLVELGQPTDRSRRLAGSAAERLAASGRRAFARGDMPAAVSLLERAAALLPPDDRRRTSILPSLGRALIDQGEIEHAEAVLSEAIESGEASGERAAAADALVARAFARLHTDPGSSHEQVRRELEGPVRLFEELHDERGLGRALGLAGILRLWDGNAAAAAEEFRKAARLAAAAGDRAQEVESLRYLLTALLYGPTPVPAARRLVNDVARRGRGHPKLDTRILQVRAHLEAMRGRFEVARGLMARAQSAAHEVGLEMDLAAGIRRSACEIELLAGDPAAAERAIRPGYEALERLGVWTHIPSIVPDLVDALYEQGRLDEAIPLLEIADRWLVGEDVEAQMGLQRVRAKLLARQGDVAGAERLAREAVDLAARTDLLDFRARVIADLAEVLRLAGRPPEAAEACEQAVRLYELKGNVAAADRLRTLFAQPAPET